MGKVDASSHFEQKQSVLNEATTAVKEHEHPPSFNVPMHFGDLHFSTRTRALSTCAMRKSSSGCSSSGSSISQWWQLEAANEWRIFLLLPTFIATVNRVHTIIRLCARTRSQQHLGRCCHLLFCSSGCCSSGQEIRLPRQNVGGVRPVRACGCTALQHILSGGDRGLVPLRRLLLRPNLSDHSRIFIFIKTALVMRGTIWPGEKRRKNNSVIENVGRAGSR